MEFLGLGIDLGTSGLRVAVVNAAGNLLETKSSSYPLPFSNANGWQLGVAQLVQQLSTVLRQQIAAIAIDGTSGTLLACNKLGFRWHQHSPTAALAANKAKRSKP